MRILITGGAGFIGRHIVDALYSDRSEIVVFDNLSSSREHSLPDGVSLMVGDVADRAMPELIKSLEPELIIHAAAQASVPRSMADPEFDRLINVIGTERVIAGAKLVGQCRVVFLSTGGAVYGETSSAARESSSLPNPKSFYGAHKYLAERYLEFSGVSYGIARLANVYGPGQRSDLEGGVAAIFAERLAAGQPIEIFGDGEQSRDFVHVWDVAQAIVAIAASPRNGLWNVGSGTETSINVLLEKMEGVFGNALVKTYKPARIGDVRKSVLAIDKISEELNWTPAVSLNDGIVSLKHQAIG